MASPCEVLCETEDLDFARALGEFAAAEARRIDEKFSRYKPGSVIAGMLEQPRPADTRSMTRPHGSSTTARRSGA